MNKIFKKILSHSQEEFNFFSSKKSIHPSHINTSILDQLHSTSDPTLVLQLYNLLQKEFEYRGNTAPLKAWGYANGDLLQDLSEVQHLLSTNRFKANIKLIGMFSVLNILLSEPLKSEFQYRQTTPKRKSEILNSLVKYKLEDVAQHNCYSIIVYAAALADMISGKGTKLLLDEISASPFERMGGGLISKSGRSSPRYITNTIENITLENIDSLDNLLPLPPGRIVIYSMEGAGVPEAIQDTDKFYAHVACIGKNNQVLHFWDILENKMQESSYQIKSLDLKTLTETVLKSGSKGKPITLRLVDPPWDSYQI